MKRIVDHFLLQWKEESHRKPLLVRGARQVGKTFSIRQLGSTYPTFIEINLEIQSEAQKIFDIDLDPHRIIRELSLIARKPITPGSTLLFIDEIQTVPRAITALRYFYELMPDLHVIAAGSLLDFAIEQVGIPVGRVQSLYMYPVSFIEYLAAIGEGLCAQEILHHPVESPMGQAIHDKLLRIIGEYLALGGMPHSVQRWIEKKDPLACAKIHNTLLDTYRQDFSKYARKLQVKYVELLFEHIPLQLGHKFKYSLIEGEYRKRELAPALDLLVTAGIAHKVFHSAGQGVPLGAQMDPQDYKAIFLDIGLAQTLLNLDSAQWFLQPAAEFINKGSIVESFVGQELLAYADPNIKQNVYYWNNTSKGSLAEVDYLMQIKDTVIPIEVKSGLGRTLKSLQTFLETHPKSPYGLRFSAQDYSLYQNLQSYPLYAIARVMSLKSSDIKHAIEALI
jgi:predicted AAA+ superfamily ATPase